MEDKFGSTEQAIDRFFFLVRNNLPKAIIVLLVTAASLFASGYIISWGSNTAPGSKNPITTTTTLAAVTPTNATVQATDSNVAIGNGNTQTLNINKSPPPRFKYFENASSTIQENKTYSTEFRTDVFYPSGAVDFSGAPAATLLQHNDLVPLAESSSGQWSGEKAHDLEHSSVW